jgi:hypothetical protein
MSLHVNPINAYPNDEGIAVPPEAMVLFPEGTPEFEYVQSLIKQWDHYVSAVVPLPNTTAMTEVQIGGSVWKLESECSAYIYGWQPGSAEWIEGSCVAVVCFSLSAMTIPDVMSCTIRVWLQGDISFRGSKTVPITLEQDNQMQPE